MDWILANKEWLFSGIGVTVFAGFMAVIRRATRIRVSQSAAPPISQNNIKIINTNTNTNTNTNNDTSTSAIDGVPNAERAVPAKTEEGIRRVKDSTRILFVDDDEKFR